MIAVLRHNLGWHLALLVLLTTGCGSLPPAGEGDEEREPSPAIEGRATSRSFPAGTPRIVILGDSLTAGLGVSRQEAYPALLQRKLDAAGLKFEVVNAGVSGDTSAGGLRRLDWSLEGEVAGLVVALGGNDGLRGLPVEELKSNLSMIIATAKQRQVEVLLAGMEAPPNFGLEYTDAFRSVYRDLADEHEVAFVPFLLDGVAGVADLNQDDGIHPNARGAAEVANHLWPEIEAMARAEGPSAR